MKNTVDFPNSISQKPLHRNLQTKIVTLYGGDAWKEIRDLEKTRVKIQRKESDLSLIVHYSLLCKSVLMMSLGLDSKHRRIKDEHCGISEFSLSKTTPQKSTNH